MQILIDLQKELHRLFIAGSGIAAGDSRLAKLLPQLRQLGEKVPVFKRLADSVEEVLGASQSDVSVKLLELSMLISAVSATQGKTEMAGDISDLNRVALDLETAASFRKLNPVVKALTTTGSGRLEQLQESLSEKVFVDVRVVEDVLSALADKYSEIPDFVQNKMIPEYGKQVVPLLQQSLNLKGGTADVRRLKLIRGFLGDDALDLVLEAAKTGSADMKAAAIELLGTSAEHEALLLDMSYEKSKDVRLTALFALQRLGTERAQDRLIEAVTAKGGELAIEPFRISPSRELLLRLIAHAEEELLRLQNSPAPKRSDSLKIIQIIVRCLKDSGSKVVDEVQLFLQRLLTAEAFNELPKDDAHVVAAELLLELNTPEANRFALELEHEHKEKYIGFSFRAATRLLNPTEIYDRFAGVLSDSTEAASVLLNTIERVSNGQLPHRDYSKHLVVPEELWDSRWLHLFVELEDPVLVSRFTHRADEKAAEYIREQVKNGGHYHFGSRFVWHQDWLLLMALFRTNDLEAPKLFMELLQPEDGFGHINWDERLPLMISMLPESFVEKLRSLREKLAFEGRQDRFTAALDKLEANE
ncbi:hypothetical protein M3223_05345 [Paenibacillus pasadenensis]|uniref:HEAT repeat domain-containing protein n=1 Tax=Paenibacillus pasadenensis TaxID=217090 RepID=UPI00203EBD2B|nr:hypothetical protein [Paenibacillus pasadenensis]MCM3746777.1 hypothetical protein [Paenibacillus pasadenensis]